MELDISELINDCRKAVSKTIFEYGIDPAFLDSFRVVSDIEIRNALIRQKFKIRRAKGERREDILFDLWNEYDLSLDSLRKIIKKPR